MTSSSVEQRWERPLDFPPGFWKQQLPEKYLKIAAKDDLTALQDLLETHPEFLNKRGSHDRTLLWEAVRRGKLDAVTWLVERGAEIDATGCYNSESHVQITPYCAAIYYKRPQVAKYLLTQNPQFDIFRAAFLGDIERVAGFLSADPALLNAEDPEDSIYYMPLIAFAVVSGYRAMVDDLLRRGAEIAQYSAMLLHLAVKNARMDLFDLLLAHGADIHAVEAGTFHAADLDILKTLLERGVSPNQIGRGLNAFPPLVYIARGDKGEHREKIRLLLEHGAEVNATNKLGKTALHYAAAAGHTEVIKVLLEYGADKTLKDDQGQTAFSLSRAVGKSEAVALLSAN